MPMSPTLFLARKFREIVRRNKCVKVDTLLVQAYADYVLARDLRDWDIAIANLKMAEAVWYGKEAF